MYPHIWSCMTAHRLKMRFWAWGEVLTVVLWWGNNFISNHDIVRVLRNRPNFSINYSISQTIMVKIFGQFLFPFPLFLNVEILNAFFSNIWLSWINIEKWGEGGGFWGVPLQSFSGDLKIDLFEHFWGHTGVFETFWDWTLRNPTQKAKFDRQLEQTYPQYPKVAPDHVKDFVIFENSVLANIFWPWLSEKSTNLCRFQGDFSDL